ncbi:hypothetical protein DTL42_07160 [Bremerella cremea]|uniref:Integrase n=1 Tax=Bremerella cremea TaxID=1031537 RepID=A0A368KWR5_9BACT|nr:tyrosine-type recombinase/integrase [Bremerella cremea]RCS54883.1 hypothetical protein DTL42_07160 [Bremerella cremea]
MTTLLAPDDIAAPSDFLPPILSGQQTIEVQRKVERFYLSLDEMLERWIARRQSCHTQRAYRQDIESLLKFLGIRWPEDSLQLLRLSVADVQAWRDQLIAEGKAPKTLNRRVSSVSSFFKYLQGAAAELRLPITVPNPAHAQFISRASTDPVHETKHLSATRARQLMGLPAGQSLVDYRDRAILKWYVYSGVRLSTACRLNVDDFHIDGEEATVRIVEKGDKRRTIGLHFAAAEALSEYLKEAGIEDGPIFRPRKGPNTDKLSDDRLSESGMQHIVRSYLKRLPSGLAKSGDGISRCVYSTHSLRATTATLLLESGVDIRKVQELLGHRHITTTEIYDKRRRSTSESASHDMPV